MDIGKIYRFVLERGYLTFQLINSETIMVLDFSGVYRYNGVEIKVGVKLNMKGYLNQAQFICDSIEEYNDSLPYKIVYKDKIIEKIIDKAIYVDKPIMYYKETLVDKLYETYCKSKGRILNEYV